MKNGKYVQELKILEKNGINIFNCGYEFQIPIYQRGYEWEPKQIDNLIDNIFDINEKTLKYHLGIMVLKEISNNKYEVIDGQQRLTTLYLFLKLLKNNYKKYCNFEVKNCLKFKYRKKASKTLLKINELVNQKVNIEDYDFSILKNAKYINDKLKGKNFNEKEFNSLLEKINKLEIIVTEVPDKTNLIHYFEVMNSRGEQLSKVDIIKSRLLSFIGGLENEFERNNKIRVFSEVWDACSNIDSYVQKNFKNSIRESIFGVNWNKFMINNSDELFNKLKNKTAKWCLDTCTINDIVNNTKQFEKVINNQDIVNDGLINNYETESKFESIISYPVFLIHVLKVFVHQKINLDKEYIDLITDCLDNNVDESEINSLIFDKNGSSQYFNNNNILDFYITIMKMSIDKDKLIEIFELVINHLDYLNLSKEDTKSDFSQQFIYLLLKLKFLFDQYLIKREYSAKNSDGIWSLKKVKKTIIKNKNSDIIRPELTFHKDENKNIIMLESLLRVSYTSPKVMHWITKLLIYLNENSVDESNYSKYIEKMIKSNIKNIFNENNKSSIDINNKYWYKGVDIHHLVFNYLDYLLWKENSKKYDNFTFDYRNSVEHFYPRHPRNFEKWEDNIGLNFFGNLCLVSRNFNSTLSDDSPLAKASSNSKEISNGSLKLRIMASYMNKIEDVQKWKDETSEKHGIEMINKIIKAISNND